MNKFTNPSNRLGKTYPPEFVPPEKIREMLDNFGYTPKGRKTNSLTSKRDKALIAVLWRSGLRIAECLALEPKDIHLTHNKINILDGKGEEFGVVGIDLLTRDILQDWLKARSTLNPKRKTPLYCSIKGGKLGALHPNNVRSMIKTHAERVGILQRLTPHGFRHALARALAVEGKSLYEISQALRHKNPQTTAIYLATLENDLGVKAIQGRDDSASAEAEAIRAVLAGYDLDQLKALILTE